MADVYMELSDLEISRSDVQENTDVDELIAWMREQKQVAAEVTIMINTLKEEPDAHTLGLSRKLGYVRMSMMWIGNRLRELGADPEELFPRHSPGARAHLAVMERALQDKSAKLKAANVELTALRQEVKRLRKAPAEDCPSESRVVTLLHSAVTPHKERSE